MFYFLSFFPATNKHSSLNLLAEAIVNRACWLTTSKVMLFSLFAELWRCLQTNDELYFGRFNDTCFLYFVTFHWDRFEWKLLKKLAGNLMIDNFCKLKVVGVFVYICAFINLTRIFNLFFVHKPKFQIWCLENS